MLDLLVRGRHLVFDTTLDRAEATERLQREIAPPVWQLYERRPQLFEGRLEAERFSVVRLVRGRNSFRPVIEGQLLSGPIGTRVRVTLRVHPVVLIFSGFLAAIGVVIVTFLMKEWQQSGQVPLRMLPLLGLPAFVTFGALVLAGEARKAARMLETLLGVPGRRPEESLFHRT
jgi:hypothetical protein